MGLNTYDFFISIENYYGKSKNPIIKEVTKNYIERTYKQNALKNLLVAVYRSHRSAWGFPDVAAVEIAHDKFMKSGSNNLKESKTVEYKNPIKPLTDEELIQSEEGGARYNFKELLGKITIIATEQSSKHDPDKMKEAKEELKQC